MIDSDWYDRSDTKNDDLLLVLWTQQQIIDNIMNVCSNIGDKVIHVMKSGSMIPLISVDSNILMDLDNKTEQFDRIGTGDIVAFKAPDPAEENKLIIHRLSAIIDKGNNPTSKVILCAPIVIKEVIQEKTILSRGDANECSIP